MPEGEWGIKPKSREWDNLDWREKKQSNEGVEKGERVKDRVSYLKLVL